MIKNNSKISYYINKTKQKVGSNCVLTTKINPIIIFKKCIQNCLVTIFICNNSEIAIRNARFCDDFSNIIENSLYINNKPYLNNLKNYIYLGSITNGEMMKITYQIKKELCNNALLSYDIIVNNHKSNLFLISN